MYVCKRPDTPFDGVFQSFGSLGLGKLDGRLNIREQVLAPVFCFACEDGDLLLAALLLGDVPRDLRRTDNLAFTVSDWRNSQRNDDQAAVLALSHRLEMIDTLPSPDAGQNGAFFVLPILGDDDHDRAPARLFGGVAEDALSTFVPACDQTVEVLAHDRIVARLDDRGEEAQTLLAVAKRRFELVALGNIDPGGVEEHDGSSPIEDRMHRKIHDALATVGDPISQLFAEDEPRSG